MCVVRGEPFLGRATQQGPVAYLFLDDFLPEVADVFVSLGLRESDPLYLQAGSAPVRLYRLATAHHQTKRR
jgi:hypothetical protein